MLFSTFVLIPFFLKIATSIPQGPQGLQNDVQIFQNNLDQNLEPPTFGLSQSDLNDLDQGLTPIEPQSPPKQPVGPDASLNFVALKSTSGALDSATEPPYGIDHSASSLASTTDPNTPDPKVPIILPDGYVLPPGIGTCKGNPGNNDENDQGQRLKTVYCCVHRHHIMWSFCRKFNNGYRCDPNSKDIVFACCKGIQGPLLTGPGIECEEAPGESVRRKKFNPENVKQSPTITIPQGVGDDLWNIFTYPNPAVRIMEGVVNGKKDDPRL